MKRVTSAFPSFYTATYKDDGGDIWAFRPSGAAVWVGGIISVPHLTKKEARRLKKDLAVRGFPRKVTFHCVTYSFMTCKGDEP